MPGQKVKSKFEILPTNSNLPIICGFGSIGIIVRSYGRMVNVRFENGNSCDCMLSNLEIL